MAINRAEALCKQVLPGRRLNEKKKDVNYNYIL